MTAQPPLRAAPDPYWVIAARCLCAVMDLHRDRAASEPLPDILGFLPDPAHDPAAHDPAAHRPDG